MPRKPDRRGTDVENQTMILIMIGRTKCPAFIATFLMPGNAVNRVWLAVEQEAALLIHLHGAEAERLRDFINHHAIAPRVARSPNKDKGSLRPFQR